MLYLAAIITFQLGYIVLKIHLGSPEWIFLFLAIDKTQVVR